MNDGSLPGLSVSKLTDEFVRWHNRPAKLRFGQYIAAKYLIGDWPELESEPDFTEVIRICTIRLIQSEAQS